MRLRQKGPGFRYAAVLPLGSYSAVVGERDLHAALQRVCAEPAAAWGWHLATPEPEELLAQFMKLFYGPEARAMTEAYRLIDEAAQFWATSWDRVPAERGPSYKKYMHWDETLALPHLPLPVNLSNHPFWRGHYRNLLVWPVYPHNPYADGPETSLEHAVGALSVPLILKSQPGRYVRPDEQEIAFAVTVP